jgi:hypothetical protein
MQTPEVFTVLPGRAHNIYLPAGAILHTVKHGDCPLAGDWHPSIELDLQTKHLTEREILARA